jgi:hypothetical protein
MIFDPPEYITEELRQLREQNTLLDIELAKSEALLHQCFEVLTGPTCHQSTQWARLVETLAERLK